MRLDATLEKFYLSSLAYAGLELTDNVLKNKNEKLGDYTIDGKFITLPYYENLKDPGDKAIFHLLNESYTNPENAIFNQYRKKLTLELNLKLSSLIISLISIASDVQLQQKVKSSKLIDIISNIGEVDHTLIEAFLNTVKASKKEHSEAFLFDIYLKKNGEVNDVPYAAIGKINFHLYNEVNKSIEEKDRDYRVYGYKLRKKDLLAFNNLFNVIFPDINNPQAYIEGTDNKVFRYLNILLKTSYIVSSRLNELASILGELKEPSLLVEDIVSDLEWTNTLERLYDMTNEIRLIPNQTDINMESNRLKVDESKVKNEPVQEQKTHQINAPHFDPTRVGNSETNNQPSAPMQVQQNNQPRQLTAEEIIRGIGQPSQYPMQQPMMQPMMQQPMMMGMQPQMPMQAATYTPQWVQLESMKANQQAQMQQPMMQNMQPQMGMQMMQQPMMQPMMQQPMMMGVQPQMGMPMMQPMMGQQPMMQGMQPQFEQGSSLQINPHFLNRGQAPFF